MLELEAVHVETPAICSGAIGTPSSWNSSVRKRLFDLFLACLLLVPALPLMLAIAVIVKCTSGGPVLFRQERVGRNGHKFRILKFRTMVHSPSDSGLKLTRSGDSRITTAGRWLRKLKLDELPQLFNVLRADMSLVGPRPDVPQFYDRLEGDQRQVLFLKPGLTGWATLHFQNEEALLSAVAPDQLLQVYVAQVLPKKVHLDLDYASRASFVTDLAVLFRTAFAIVM